MPKSPIPYYAGDISTVAKSLRNQLGSMDQAPSHVEMLNLLAKAVGYRNFQHYRSQLESKQALRPPMPTITPEVDYKRVRRTVRFFDENARLIRWPKKFTQRMICLWVLWARIPARKEFTEKAISDFIESRHLFGDHALLRRELVDRGMVERTADGRSYKRVEVQPSAEAMEVLRLLQQK